MKSRLTSQIIDNLREILPELEGQAIDPDMQLVDLGANSLDRGELITLTLEQLELNVPRIEFVQAQTVNELAEIIANKLAPATKD